MEPIAEFKTITPEMAQRILDDDKKNRESYNLINNEALRNRKISKALVANYANLIRKGQWQVNGDTIRISEDGILIDGQHRLSAIIAANTPVKAFIVRGVKTDSFITIDCGKKRSLGDVFSSYGITNPRTKAAMILRYNALKQGRCIVGKPSFGGTTEQKSKLSREDGLDLYFLFEDIMQQTSSLARRSYRGYGLLNVALIGAITLYLVIDKFHKFEKVEKFFIDLCVNLTCENEPINTLRSKLWKDRRAKEKLPDAEVQVLIIKTWNAYIRGKGLKKYRTNENDSNLDFC